MHVCGVGLCVRVCVCVHMLRQCFHTGDVMVPQHLDAVAPVLALLQLGIGSLVDRINSLPRRFMASRDVSSVHGPLLVQGLAEAWREAAFDCGVLASCVDKMCEGASEEARVAAAQLAAYAVLLEREAADEEEEESGVEGPARSLFSLSPTTCIDCQCTVVISCDPASLFHAVDAATRVRDGIDPLRCTVRGVRTYWAGENRVCVSAADAEGEAVESIEAEDV
ncbi:MAG: hypothetical protein P4L40_18340, partial [Terracidiphilus sp.]|nr:hypothetical protein [Terracidiphilus sp.]